MRIGDLVDVFIPYSVEISCSHCRKVFHWTVASKADTNYLNMPRYCSSSHAKKASAKRCKERRKNSGKNFRCVTPQKAKYSSKEDAWVMIRERHDGDLTIMPYICTCGFFHNGHSKDIVDCAA